MVQPRRAEKCEGPENEAKSERSNRKKKSSALNKLQIVVRNKIKFNGWFQLLLNAESFRGSHCHSPGPPSNIALPRNISYLWAPLVNSKRFSNKPTLRLQTHSDTGIVLSKYQTAH